MKDSDFEQLIVSVKQAGSIKRGKMEPSRTFEVGTEDMKVEPGQTPARRTASSSPVRGDSM